MLMEVQLKVLSPSHEDCKIDGDDPDTKLCGGSYVTGKTPCHADSGGPLFISHQGHHKLIGIVSYAVMPIRKRKT